MVADLTESENHEVYALRDSESLLDTGDREINTADSFSRYNLRCVFEVYRLLDKEDFDTVHCHLAKSKMVGWMVKLVSGQEFDLVFHEHGKIMKDNRGYELFLKLSKGKVSKYIAVSEEVSHQLEGSGVSGRDIELLYNFVDREKFNPETVRKFDLKEDLVEDFQTDKDFVLGFAGRIVDLKGWQTLVSAVKNMEDVKLIIAGSGPEEQLLQKRIAESENIMHVGYLEEIRKLLGTIDCLVLPSFRDASPMTLYEAQSAGVPVICSNVASMNELVEHRKNGVLFEPGNVEELRSVITELKEDPELRNQLRKSGLEFAGKHSLIRYRNQLEGIYGKLGEGQR